MARDLHQALKTEVIRKSSASGCDFTLVRMQWSKTDSGVGFHVNPNSYTSAGIQTTDFLNLLGFQRSGCVFFPGGQCYSKQVPEDFDLDAFGQRFGQAYDRLDKSDSDLQACGYVLPGPEGWGYFLGKPSEGKSYQPSWSGDGHTAGTIERMKASEDATFNFVFTWIAGGHAGRGWNIHYRPKHTPPSAEIDGIFRFLGAKTFKECPEFDFEQCFYRFIPFGDNAQWAHGVFDRHAASFSSGIEKLLEAHATIEFSGFKLLPFPETHARHRQEIQARVVKPTHESPSLKRSPDFDFDAAVSFAGTNRKEALELATKIRDAGFSVFYDDFYPEDLWGKDLTVFFDEIFRKRSRYCVIFVSKEYLARPWTIHERRSAMARAIEERGNDYILPIRVDDAELPGLQPTIGYMPISKGVENITETLLKKLKKA